MQFIVAKYVVSVTPCSVYVNEFRLPAQIVILSKSNLIVRFRMLSCDNIQYLALD